MYFDSNDFDVALLAPAAWGVLRLLASVLVARHALGLKRAQAERLCRAVIKAYGLALATGNGGWIDRASAEGPVQQLLAGLRQRKMAAFVARPTTLSTGKAGSNSWPCECRTGALPPPSALPGVAK